MNSENKDRAAGNRQSNAVIYLSLFFICVIIIFLFPFSFLIYSKRNGMLIVGLASGKLIKVQF